MLYLCVLSDPQAHCSGEQTSAYAKVWVHIAADVCQADTMLIQCRYEPFACSKTVKLLYSACHGYRLAALTNQRNQYLHMPCEVFFKAH